MTDVLNIVENIETLNMQTGDSLLLKQLLYSCSLWLPNSVLAYGEKLFVS